MSSSKGTCSIANAFTTKPKLHQHNHNAKKTELKCQQKPSCSSKAKNTMMPFKCSKTCLGAISFHLPYTLFPRSPVDSIYGGSRRG